MKSSLFFVLVLLSAAFSLHAEENRSYLPKGSLSITEEGIFLKTKCHTAPLNSLFYDYDMQSFYVFANSGVTLLRCAACNRQTWWQEQRCCLFEDCPYYCY